MVHGTNRSGSTLQVCIGTCHSQQARCAAHLCMPPCWWMYASACATGCMMLAISTSGRPTPPAAFRMSAMLPPCIPACTSAYQWLAMYSMNSKPPPRCSLCHALPHACSVFDRAWHHVSTIQHLSSMHASHYCSWHLLLLQLEAALGCALTSMYGSSSSLCMKAQCRDSTCWCLYAAIR